MSAARVVVASLIVACLLLSGSSAAKASKKKGARAAASTAPPPADVVHNATTLHKLRANHPHLLVLYTVPQWAWCDDCARLRNATDVVRAELLSDAVRQNPAPLRTNAKGKTVKKAAPSKKTLAEQREKTVHVAVVDCSAVLPKEEGHPCTGVAAFPTLVLFQTNATSDVSAQGKFAAQQHVYDGFADAHGVFKFLLQHVPAVAAREAALKQRQMAGGAAATMKDRMTEASLVRPGEPTRAAVRRVASQLETMRAEALVDYVGDGDAAHAFVLLFTPGCRTCAADYVAMERLAAHLAAGGDGGVKLARVAYDAHVRNRQWLLEARVPQLLFFAGGGDGAAPIIYSGPRTTSAIVMFLRFHTRVTLPMPAVADDQAVGALTKDALKASTNVIRSYSEFNAAMALEMDGVRTTRPALFMFVADWTAPRAVVIEEAVAFSKAAIAAKTNTLTQPVRWYIVDLTDSDAAAMIVLDDRVRADAATPFVQVVSHALTDGATPREGAVVPYQLAVTEANLGAYVMEKASADATDGRGSTATGRLLPPSDGEPYELRRGIYHLETLEPLAAMSTDEELEATPELLSLPFGFYDGIDHMFVLFTFHGDAVEAVASREALQTFETAAQLLKAHVEGSKAIVTESSQCGLSGGATPADVEREGNLTLATMDAGRHTFAANAISEELTARRRPFLVHLIRNKLIEDTGVFFRNAVDFVRVGNGSTAVVPLQKHAVPRDAFLIIDNMLDKAGLPERFDKKLMDLTANNFEAVAHDPSKGVLVLFYSPTCPHSAALMPTYARAAGGFADDTTHLVMARLSLDDVDDKFKADFDVMYFPQIRWFGKGAVAEGQRGGDLFDATPFKDAIIEYVSEEMGFPHVDLMQATETAGPFATVTSKDFDARVVAADTEHTVLFLFNGRIDNKRKLDVLRRVGWHFSNLTDTGEELVDEEQLPGEGAQPDDEMPVETLDDGSDPRDIPQDKPSDLDGATKLAGLPKTRPTKEPILRVLPANVTFLSLDAARYGKLLKRSGIRDVPRGDLPLLLFLPAGAYKLNKIKRFSHDATFSEVSIARWVTEIAGFGGGFVEQYFNFTEAEVERENDPRMEGVTDLDMSGFGEFLRTKRDVVILYYASWCRFSKDFMPLYAKAADHFAGDESVAFGKVDTPSNPDIGHHQGLVQFPTVYIYFQGALLREELRGEEYKGELNAKALIEYVTNIRGTNKVQQLDANRAKRHALVRTFDEQSFKAQVEEGSESALIEFHASWCGHCKTVQYMLAEIVDVYRSVKRPLLVGKVDAEQLADVARKYNATKGFPVIFLFKVDTDKMGRTKRSVHRYEGERIFPDTQKFLEATAPALKLTQPEIQAFEQQRNLEESIDYERLMSRDGTAEGDPKLGTDAAKPAANDEDDDEEEAAPVKKAPAKTKAKAKKTPVKDDDGDDDDDDDDDDDEGEPEELDLRDGQSRDGPAFDGFSKEVNMLERASFREAIEGTKVVLLLHHALPGDERIISTFNDAAQIVQPAVKQKSLSVAAIEASEFTSTHPLIGESPSLTLFRGLATPATVRFDQNKFADFGDGGSLANLTEVLEFVKKHLAGTAAQSVEISTKLFNKVRANGTMTVLIFFYAPWCEECRDIADQYDAVAQAVAHLPHVAVTRIDVSANPGAYRDLGEQPLPAIFVYDRVPGSDADAKVRRKVRRLTTKRPSTEDMAEFALLNEEAAASDADDGDVDELATADGQRESAEMLKRDRQAAADDDSDGRKYEPLHIPTATHLNITLVDFPRGMLLLLVADWCPHCGRYAAMYTEAVGPLRRSIVVAQMDITADPALAQRFGVAAVPAVLFLSRGESGEGAIAVKAFTGKKSAANFVKFARKAMLKTRDIQLPEYTLVDEAKRGAEKPVLTDDVQAGMLVDDVSRAQLSQRLTADGASGKPAVLFVVSAWCGKPCAAARATAYSVGSALRHVAAVSIFNATEHADGQWLRKEHSVLSMPTAIIRCAGGKMHSFTSLSKKKMVSRIAVAVEDRCLAASGQSGEDRRAAEDVANIGLMKVEGGTGPTPTVMPADEVALLRREHDMAVFMRPLKKSRCVDDCVALSAAWDRATDGVAMQNSKKQGTAEALVKYAVVDSDDKNVRKALTARGLTPPLIGYIHRDGDTDRELSPADIIVDALAIFKKQSTKKDLIDFIRQSHRDNE
jgi:thioredoxin-like negative regulator of GroEL